jgi:hypothetical protein
MTTPISAGSSWNPYVCQADDDPQSPKQSIGAPHRDPPPPPAHEGFDASSSSHACSLGCGVATSLACAAVGFGTAAALSPTVVGAAAGAAIGLNCGLLSTLVCDQVCGPGTDR